MKITIEIPCIFHKWVYVKSNTEKVLSAEMRCLKCGKKKILSSEQIKNLLFLIPFALLSCADHTSPAKFPKWEVTTVEGVDTVEARYAKNRHGTLYLTNGDANINIVSVYTEDYWKTYRRIE